MTITNGGGENANRLADFAIYDNLPPAVRETLRNAPINLGSGSARRLLYKYDEKETAVSITEFVKDMMVSGHEEGTRRYWGADHPQALRETKWKYVLSRLLHRTRLVQIERLRR